MEGMYVDGVPVCDDCGGALCLARLSECNNPDHRDFDLMPPFIAPLHVDDFPSDVAHSWHNWLDAIGPEELESPPYICKCGEEFDTHKELMKHTSESNPKLDTLTMGRAGAAIEREAHTKTLDLLRRARDILLITDDVTDESVNTLLDDISKQCPVLAEEDEKN